ncbi:unnamed protein product [Clonostachys byssicola]|uniref:Elongation factor methyltransferase 7 n=1 Tax=Clonostachys byssicola TaxID=160290 RepID=A0A9N9UQC8_9HYPO|nr:unnamed protein product [Clonostachys byssicola]
MAAEDLPIDLSEAGFMDDPEDYYPPTPPPTKEIFTMKSGKSITLHLVGHSPTEAHTLWNGAKIISDYFEKDPSRIKGKTMLELGAASGLPSLVAAILGAKKAVMTDFPDPDIVATMQRNIDECDETMEVKGRLAGTIDAMGFIWGREPEPLLERLSSDGRDRFDVLVLADLLFRHSEHGALVKTIRETMRRSPESVAYVFFTSYRPWKKDLDMAFFDVARDAGLEVEQVEEVHLEKPLFKDDPGDLDVQKTVKGFAPNHAAGPRPKKLNLDHLPLEIVLRIYEFALVERPRWEKTHKPTCKYKPKFGDDIYENPPFLQTKVTVYADMTQKTECSCSCAKRTGLGLLLASRGVNELAAPIFWSRNTFCFLDAIELIATVGRLLRPAYVEMIRAISIMNPDQSGYTGHVDYTLSKGKQRHAFWDTLERCRGLESLDMPGAYISATKWFSQRMAKLPKRAPSLKTVRFNFLLTFTSYDMWSEYPSPWWDHYFPNVIYARCSRSFSLRDQDWNPKAVQELARGLKWNFRVYVGTAIKTSFLGASRERPESYKDTFRLAEGIDEHSSRRRVTLPTGEATTVTFYGFPLSKRDRMDQARRKRALDGQQRKINRLTHAQNEAVVKAKEKRKVKRETQVTENRESHNQAIADRGQRLLDLKAEEDRAARKQQRKIDRTTKRNAEIHRSERKRIRCCVYGRKHITVASLSGPKDEDTFTRLAGLDSQHTYLRQAHLGNPTTARMSSTPHLSQLERDGFVVVRAIVSPAKLERLRDASTKATSLARSGGWPHVRTVGKQFPPWSAADVAEKGIWGVQHLMNPDLGGHDLFAEQYFSEEVLSIVRELLQCSDDDLVMELFNMLVRPESDFELRWHRDDIPAEASAQEEMERLGKPAFHAQYNFALFDDDSLVVVPGSHRRARTDTERAAGPFEKVLPDQLVVKLGPGDIVFYNNNILHRGVYDSTKERMTLHGSVGHVGGSALRARNVLQHGVGDWVAGCNFSRLEGRDRERAEAMRERLVKMGSASGEVGYSLQG